MSELMMMFIAELLEPRKQRWLSWFYETARCKLHRGPFPEYDNPSGEVIPGQNPARHHDLCDRVVHGKEGYADPHAQLRKPKADDANYAKGKEGKRGASAFGIVGTAKDKPQGERVVHAQAGQKAQDHGPVNARRKRLEKAFFGRDHHAKIGDKGNATDYCISQELF